MMEKQNTLTEKKAAGDARAIDDIVDGAAVRFAKRTQAGVGRRRLDESRDEHLTIN